MTINDVNVSGTSFTLFRCKQKKKKKKCVLNTLLVQLKRLNTIFMKVLFETNANLYLPSK